MEASKQAESSPGPAQVPAGVLPCKYWGYLHVMAWQAPWGTWICAACHPQPKGTEAA